MPLKLSTRRKVEIKTIQWIQDHVPSVILVGSGGDRRNKDGYITDWEGQSGTELLFVSYVWNLSENQMQQQLLYGAFSIPKYHLFPLLVYSLQSLLTVIDAGAWKTS